MLSLDELTIWRKEGLLPPMANTGLGTGRGKSYYWREENILAQAKIVYDAMRRHGRAEQTLVTLFLSGFRVSLPQLRRAWLHRVKLRKPLTVRKGQKNRGTGTVTTPGADHLLLQAALWVGAAVETEDASQRNAVMTLLERALSKLGLARHGANEPGLADQIWHLLIVITSVLDTSDLIREAGDDELRSAQRYLGMTLEFLRSCGDTPDTVLETLGARLFQFILLLLRSGQIEVLDHITIYMKGTGWPAISPPARVLSLSA